ncbi:MAG: hypothetical protein JW797_09505 [Bradymonadales bacterium]|nr:hypothetical protein [Bradymonadales bacterium]
MNQPLDVVRAALSTTPREREYLELDTTGWSDSDKALACAELVSAAKTGDWRVPAVLWTVLGGSKLENTLKDLLNAAPPRVRVEAGWELLRLLQDSFKVQLGDILRRGQLDRHGLIRAFDLLLASGGEHAVLDLIEHMTSEDARTAAIERLWSWRRYDQYPSVWWRDLGLLKRTLEIPNPSFRRPALKRLGALLQSSPAIEGYAPVAPQAIPAALLAAMQDVDKGRGPIPEPLLAALGEAEKQALLIYAADVARNRDVPRGVLYVGRLGGTEHRDLLEWAAAHRVPAFAQAGAQALSELD